MSSIASDLQRILDLAPRYSRTRTPAMIEREMIGRDLERNLTDALKDIAARLGLAELDFKVKAGGIQGSVSPLPWVRIYAPEHSPSAQKGVYLVYLFAADGSRVYLSLNQGTSVPKAGGGMRATNDRDELAARANKERSHLGDLAITGRAPRAVSSIDLAANGLESQGSKIRARAYVAANITALEYLAGQIPTDEQLLRDLEKMLPLLARLYGVELEPSAIAAVKSVFDATSLQKLAAGDRGLEIDQRVYRAIIAALESGKHVILTGPPGTAKTTLAEVTCQLAADSGRCSGYRLTTATADWTTYETIGGLRPAVSVGSLEFHEGLFLEAIRAGQWLVIDELNRSNFDRAFGQLFTVLSGQSVVLPYEDRKHKKPVALVLEGNGPGYSDAEYAVLRVPQTWRIIATMNVFDKSLLFEMSFALMRRFAFIEVPSPSKGIFAELWRRQLEGLPQGSKDLVDDVLTRLFEELSDLRIKDIGPAVFIDMARFSRAYMDSDTEIEPHDLTFQLFYSYLLPQFEGISTPQAKQLLGRIGNLVGNHRDHLRTILAEVLGADLRPPQKQAGNGSDPDWPDDDDDDNSDLTPGTE